VSYNVKIECRYGFAVSKDIIINVNNTNEGLKPVFSHFSEVSGNNIPCEFDMGEVRPRLLAYNHVESRTLLTVGNYTNKDLKEYPALFIVYNKFGPDNLFTLRCVNDNEEEGCTFILASRNIGLGIKKSPLYSSDSKEAILYGTPMFFPLEKNTNLPPLPLFKIIEACAEIINTCPYNLSYTPNIIIEEESSASMLSLSLVGALSIFMITTH
jgi:hypothetical protein